MIKAMEMPRITAKDYFKNMRKAGDLPTCIICGKGIKSEHPNMVRVYDRTIVGEVEYKNWRATDCSRDMGLNPIGPECLKQHPEIKEYIVHE